MFLTLKDPSVDWVPNTLTPDIAPYTVEEFEDGKYVFSGDGFSMDFGDSGTGFDYEEIVGKTIQDIFDSFDDISLLYVVLSDNGDYRVTGSAMQEVFYSSAGDDIMRGGGGDDSLWSQQHPFDAEPRLVDGDDIYIGGQGADYMYAGSGSDVFIFNDADGAFRDEIDNFSSRDMILTQTKLRDGNGDGKIETGKNKVFDLANGGKIAIDTTVVDRALLKLEYDGQVSFEGVNYFVYSTVGSAGTLALAQAHFDG